MATALAKHELMLFMTPRELRDLADKMEARWPKLRAGENTCVDVLHFAKDVQDTTVTLHMEQRYFHDRDALPHLRKELIAMRKDDNRYIQANELDERIRQIEKSL